MPAVVVVGCIPARLVQSEEFLVRASQSHCVGIGPRAADEMSQRGCEASRVTHHDTGARGLRGGGAAGGGDALGGSGNTPASSHFGGW